VSEYEPEIRSIPVDLITVLNPRARNKRKRTRQSSDALLAGKLYDDGGNRMSPTWARKESKRWRYYVSQAALQGEKSKAGSILRVPAADVETLVTEALGKLSPDRAASQTHIRELIDRVVISHATIRIHLSEVAEGSDGPRILTLPWTRPSPYRKREIIQGANDAKTYARPMPANARDPYRCPSRRASLAGRTSFRSPSDLGVDRFARRQEQAFDPDDPVARFPRAGDRQGGS
jgi:site-specific DNA recombinase